LPDGLEHSPGRLRIQNIFRFISRLAPFKAVASIRSSPKLPPEVTLGSKIESEFTMALRLLRVSIFFVLALPSLALAQQSNNCSALTTFKYPGVEITRATPLPDGATEPNPYGMPGRSAPLPAHCRVEGILNRRKGADGEEFGIRFALALPDKWNGDFLMQGGGGGNGVVQPPIGATAAGDKPGLTRGFAVASNDTGHKSKTGAFDFTFMRDQQAYLDFAYLANAEVAELAKQIIAAYYSKPAAYSYFAGCSTGGREGMILSQRYPNEFNGIISGDPAMRTGFSNLAIGQWIPVAFNQVAPKDASGKPIIAQAFSNDDRKLVMGALMQRCDSKDGLADGIISDPMACTFDPDVLACGSDNSESSDPESCLSPQKIGAIKRAFAGPVTSKGVQVYPGFPYDSGIAETSFIRGILAPGVGIFGPYPTAMTVDVDKEALTAAQPLVDSMSTNLTTFSAHGGKIIFYHGVSDPWFSPLDTLNYYKSLAEINGGADAVSQWSKIYLVPGMGHCGGGPSLDQFDLLSAVVDWVEKGTAPQSVTATGKAFPGRSRPLCAYPKHAQYKGQGDPQDAASFSCK
jgi:Tannase and feruloyl esterase